MKKNLFSLLIMILLISISHKPKAQESKIIETNSKTIRIEPSLANGGNMSQVFTEVNYIPLETTKESLFGDITQLEITENNYIIYDYDTKSVLIFDKAGKYITKITGAKLQANSKPTNEVFNGFILSKSNGSDIIQISLKDRIYNFNTSGILLDTKKVRDKGPSYISEYQFNDSVKVVSYYRDNKGEDKSLYKLGLLKNGKIADKYMKINDKDYKMGGFAVGGPSFIDTDNLGIKYAVNDYDYKIYKITSEGLSVAYNIVFPTVNTLPPDFNTNRIYSGKKMEYFFKNSKKIFGIGYTHQIGNFLYLKCGSLGTAIRQNGSFVYNIKDNYLISLNRLDPDSLSHFLPVISKRWDSDFKKYANKYLYTCLSSLEMFSYYEENKNKNHKYPPIIEEYFKTSNKKSNPVIVQLNPKTF